MNKIHLRVVILFKIFQISLESETDGSFILWKDKRVDNSTYAINSISSNQCASNLTTRRCLSKCLSMCLQYPNCLLVTFSINNQICYLHNTDAFTSLTNSIDSSTRLYRKKNDLKNLFAYWPIYSNDIRDYVTSEDVTYCQSKTFVSNRFGYPSSALYLNLGYCQVPTRLYFDGGQFTISAWVNVQTVQKWSRLIDFSNGAFTENILVALSQDTTGVPGAEVFYNYPNSSYNMNLLTGQMVLGKSQWHYLATVYNVTHLFLYIDGTLNNMRTVDAHPKNMTRTLCYIGKSNWESDSLANAYFDDIKIYNRALSQNEILVDMYGLR